VADGKPLDTTPLIYLVMGVSASGKTTLGQALAQRLGVPFHDGDDFHPPQNIKKMERGQPLTDQDRVPWLNTLRCAIEQYLDAEASAVFACSALRADYRDALIQGDHESIQLIFLDVPHDVLADRLRERNNHFFDPGLLDDQLDTLEPPTREQALILDGTQPPSALLQQLFGKAG